MRFDLIDLQLFVHIAQAGSLTRGAAGSNLSLAAASERVRKMEDLAGVALLERRRRGIRLTAAGRAFVHHAQLALQQIECLKSELSEHAGGLKGQVRLLANAAAVSEFLPATIRDFLRTHPGIDVDIEEKPSDEIVRAVSCGHAELGVVADIVDFRGLETRPFATDRLVLVTPVRHRLATARSRLSFSALLEEDFVGLAATNALQQHLGWQADRAGKTLKLRVRLASFDAVCRMVGSGIGVGIVPETAARRCKRTAAVRICRLEEAWALRQLHVCARSSRDLAAPARLLWEYLRATKQ